MNIDLSSQLSQVLEQIPKEVLYDFMEVPGTRMQEDCTRNS